MQKTIKIILAAMLLLCLADMPYGYYMLVRFVSMVSFSYFAYQSYTQNRIPAVFIYAGLALLFQPFFKIALGRDIWQVVDVIVAMGLVLNVWREKRVEKE